MSWSIQDVARDLFIRQRNVYLNKTSETYHWLFYQYRKDKDVDVSGGGRIRMFTVVSKIWHIKILHYKK